MDTVQLSLSEAERLIENALRASGASDANARSVAIALVQAEAVGQVGHGFSRLEDYAAQVRAGKVNGTATPQLHADKAALRIDAQDGFAYPALDLAISAGLDAARDYGCASMSVYHSHHCGALSVQVAKIAEAGQVGMMVANAPASIAPWGASTPLYGTNPIAFAAPRAEGPPLVIDLSLSRVARGKIMHAKKSGQPIPEGWALDASGAPTTDAETALKGTMVPMGDAKGTALALMVEILAASFTAANPSTEVSSFFSADGPPSGSGQFLLALNPTDGFTTRIEGVLTALEALEGARLPGKRRVAHLEQAEKVGISVPTAYVDTAQQLAGAAT